ncbi:MAG: DUF1828 domain-containing protein [candidate division WOR-3 bacterium]
MIGEAIRISLERARKLVGKLNCFKLHEEWWGIHILTGIPTFDEEISLLLEEVATQDLFRGKNMLKVSDGGATLASLFVRGLHLDPARVRKLNIILEHFGIKQGSGDELYVFTSEEELEPSIKRLLAAILTVHALYLEHILKPYEKEERELTIAFRGWYEDKPEPFRKENQLIIPEHHREIIGTQSRTPHRIDYGLWSSKPVFVARVVQPYDYSYNGFWFFSLDVQEVPKMAILLQPEKWRGRALEVLENLSKQDLINAVVRWEGAESTGELREKTDEILEIVGKRI